MFRNISRLYKEMARSKAIGMRDTIPATYIVAAYNEFAFITNTFRCTVKALSPRSFQPVATFIFAAATRI